MTRTEADIMLVLAAECMHAKTAAKYSENIPEGKQVDQTGSAELMLDGMRLVEVDL